MRHIKLFLFSFIISIALDLEAQTPNHGTIYGVTTNGTFSTDVPSVINSYTRSLFFDGIDDYVAPTAAIDFGAAGIPVSMGIRFKVSSFGNGSRVILSNSSNANTYLSVSDTAITIQGDEGNTSSYHQTLSATLSTNTWYSLVITRVSSYVWIYLYNGTTGSLITSNSFYQLYGQITFDRLGIYHTGVGDDADYNFHGKLSDLRFWDSNLSSTNANAYGSNSSTSTLQYLHWKMNETSGTTVHDTQTDTTTSSCDTCSIDTSSVWTRLGTKIYYNHGNVGIGTTNPLEKLSVNGTVLAKKVKVSVESSDWPDYVFDKKYKLPSLNELEKFIQRNKHLPGIISAKEIEKNGLNVGDNQALLLKKIEELTLLMIRLDKKVNAFKLENKRLNRKSKK